MSCSSYLQKNLRYLMAAMMRIPRTTPQVNPITVPMMIHSLVNPPVGKVGREGEVVPNLVEKKFSQNFRWRLEPVANLYVVLIIRNIIIIGKY